MRPCYLVKTKYQKQHLAYCKKLFSRTSQGRSACRGRRTETLLKQERIQGPENAPIVRFDEIRCYRSGSKKATACDERAALMATAAVAAVTASRWMVAAIISGQSE